MFDGLLSGYWTSYIIVLPAIIIAMIAQARVSSTFNKYKKVKARIGLRSHEMARKMLDYNGLTDVKIERVKGRLSDHYDPRKKVLRLSESTYDSDSVAALGIAAHEAGHAIQHAEHYGPLKLRGAMVPLASFGSNISIIMIIIGLIFSIFELAVVGIFFFLFVVIFQIVTLPVEFNASNRALAALEGGGFMATDELAMTNKVLRAAALTYVAAVLVSLANLLRFIILVLGRR